MTVKEIKLEGEDNISQGPGTEPFPAGGGAAEMQNKWWRRDE